MSKAQHGLTASEAEPTAREPVPDHLSRPVAVARGEAYGELGTDNGSGLGGHTLLSHPPAPQGRRSLFRR